MQIPPTPDTLDGKLGGVMVKAHLDKALILDEVIYAIRHGDRRMPLSAPAASS